MNINTDPVIVDPKGQPIQSERYAPCPKCGRGTDKRVPSGGFGQTWLICQCGYEFERKLLCPSVS